MKAKHASRLGLRAIFWMAWRTMTARNKKTGISFMTTMSVVGVMIGVAALIIVLSVMGGFEHDLRDRLLKGQPHLEVTNKVAAVGFALTDYPLQKFKDVFTEATDIEPYTQADVVVKQGKHMASVTLLGIQPDREQHLWGFGAAMVEGKLSEVGTTHQPIISWQDDDPKYPGIILGAGLALQLSAQKGDEIIIISPQGATEASSAFSGGTLTRRYVLVGTFQTNAFDYDNKWAIVDLAEGRRFLADYDESLDEDQYVTGVAMNFADPYIVADLADKEAEFKDLSFLNWQKANKSLLFALKLEKFTMGSILMLIVLVASFSISGTMMMTVFHRRSQVSLLRSLGMTKKDIAKLFLAHGCSIGTFGILLGLGLGVGICVLLDQLQFLEMPGQAYYLKKVPVKFLPSNYAVIAALAWLLAVAASTYPAITASRQNPVTGLKI